MITTLFIFIFIFILLLLLLLLIDGLPLKEPPNDFIEKLKEDNIILEYYYVDDSNNGRGTHYQYSELSINTYVKNMKKIIDKIKLLLLKYNNDKNIIINHIQKQHWIILSLLLLENENNISLKNKNILIIGSNEPWLEAIMLNFDVSNITTIDYNKLSYMNDKIKTFSKIDFNTFYNINGSYINSYDYIFALRAFDHSGLGRYNDDIDYNGDINSINLAKLMLKDNGILFVTIPIGKDLLIWNLQRRYGIIRLPKLFNNFIIYHKLGWKDELYDSNIDYRRTIEPVFGLMKKFNYNDEL